jgi:hypothetical protein
MNLRIASLTMVFALGAGATAALAKLPPPPPMTDQQKAAAEEKKAKDAAAAEKAKADQTAAEDRAVSNYQQNMKKLGKPVPKPVAVAAQAAPPPAAGAQAAPQGNTQKAEQKGKADDARAAEKAAGKK